MNHRTTIALAGPLAALCILLGGCNTRANVSLSGNTPGQYTHVYITAQAVWFNTSSSAGPDDGGWVKFNLSTPTTVDLVAANDGTLAQLTTDLKLLAGTYDQIRLIPVDASTPLTSSAQTLGALYNAEADYVDGSGVTQQVPLELLNPDKGIGIPASLRVPVGSLGSTLGSTGSTSGFGATGSSNATSNAGIGDASLFGTSTSSTTSSTTSTTTSTTTTTASFNMSIDGTRDLVPFAFGTTPANAILLSPHPSAYDLSTVGGIQGTLTLTNVTTANGVPNVQVAAEQLSADGSRHVVVLSTTVSSAGDFTLYPLPASTSDTVSYDIVIHGPDIATIIIKNVEIPAVSSSSSTTTSGSTSTDTSTSTGTTTNTTTSSATNTVSVGTLVPRAATPYSANVATAAGSPLPAGAVVGFYQTLGTVGSVPYLIEAAPIDPFSQSLFNAQGLSQGTIDSGTYVATGETVNIVSAAPLEKAGNYRVAASASGYSDGALTTLVAAAKPSVTLAPLALASGASTGSVIAAITPATPGKYDQGQLLVSHEGALVATTPLDAVLASGGSVAAVVPSGSPASYYYVSVRVWNSGNPGGTLSRQWYPGIVDLRSGTTGTLAVTIN
ncbi:MAG TPA: DUF4382 domain-containing protein [Steroidobacteraceae bacterium]|nr:DUF4382 domain-containing protein [Steroidobacteraceae bacterium]